jgi:hypothetical protein
MIPLHFAARHSDHFADGLIDVDPLLLRWRLLDQSANSLDDFAGSLTVLDRS